MMTSTREVAVRNNLIVVGAGVMVSIDPGMQHGLLIYKPLLDMMVGADPTLH